MAQMQPFGDAFIVQTPHLNKFADRMYLQQQQEEQRRRTEMESIDKMMGEEIGTLRNVDRDEYIEKYNNYKQLKKRLLFDNKIQRNPKEFNQLQLETEKAFADAKVFAGRSAEANDAAKGLAKAYQTNPDKFATDFGQRLQYLQRGKMDTLQKSPYGDVTDITGYMYQGPDSEFIKYHQGLGKDVNKTLVKRTPLQGGLEEQVDEYGFKVNPLALKNQMLEFYKDPRNANKASQAWANIDKDEVEATIQKYNSMPAEAIEMRTGKKELPKLEIKEGMSNAEKYATFQAINRFVSEEPVLMKSGKEPNRAAIMDKQQANAKELKQIGYQNAMKLAEQRKRWSEAETEEEAEDIIDNSLNELEEESESEGEKSGAPPLRVFSNDGKLVNAHELKGRSDIKEWFAVDVTTQGPQGTTVKEKRLPDRVTFGDDGYVRIDFFKREEEGDKKGKVIRDPIAGALLDKYSHKMTKRQFKEIYGGKLFTKAETAKSLKKGNNGGGKKTNTTTPKATTKKEKTVDEWLEEAFKNK